MKYQYPPEYVEFCKTCYEGLPKDEMLPNGTDAQKALNILVKHFLGNFIISYSGSQQQWNSEAVAEILLKYPQGKIRKIKGRYL